MNQEKKKPLSSLNKSRILAVGLFIFSPLLHLLAANLLNSVNITHEDPGFMLPLLLVLAVFSPLAIIVIEKAMIFAAKERKTGFDSSEDAWLRLFIVRAALILAIFAYGLVILFLTQYDMQKMLYFYPIGIVWVFFGWPTRKRYEKFISQFEKQ